MIGAIMGISRLDEYVPKAIYSILAQSFVELEFLVVANGTSCGEIENELTERYRSDKRLRVLGSAIPQHAHALDFAIASTQFALIARMDADDVAWADSLKRKLNFMRRNSLDMGRALIGLPAFWTKT